MPLKRLRSAIPYIVPEKTDELNLAAFNAEIDVLLEQAGGDIAAFVKEHGLKLLARAKAHDSTLRRKQIVNMWICGRVFSMYRAVLVRGEWGEFVEKAGWDLRRARMAIQIYKRNTWDEIQEKKTQNQALGYKPKANDEDEQAMAGGTTPEYKKGGDRQREVETIRALRHENKRLKTALENRDTDIERWKQDSHKWEQDARKWKSMYREVTKAEFEAGGIPLGDPDPLPESWENQG